MVDYFNFLTIELRSPEARLHLITLLVLEISKNTSFIPCQCQIKPKL